MATNVIKPQPAAGHTCRSAGESGEPLPAYEARLAARHAVFYRTFRRIVNACPAGGRILDVGCGDGFFMHRFQRTGRWQSVAGLDTNAAYIRLARANIPNVLRRSIVQGAGEDLPYAGNTFDLVWSAHSMQSYQDATATIEESYRVLKPGGSLAILENDRLHAQMLPLPPELDSALMEKRIGQLGRNLPGQAFQARRCEQYLEAAGFTAIQRKTFVLERQAPWDEQTQQFYALILQDILTEARTLLRGRLLTAAENVLSPDSPNYLGEQNYRFFCELHTLFVARKASVGAVHGQEK